MGTITLDGVDFPVRHASLFSSAGRVELEVDGGHADVPEAHAWWILEPKLVLSGGKPRVAAGEQVIVVAPDGECQCSLVTHEPELVVRAEIRLRPTSDGHHRLVADGEATILGEPVHFRVETEVDEN